MIKTKSFGLAYKFKKQKNGEKIVVPIFDIHINFWNIPNKDNSPLLILV